MTCQIQTANNSKDYRPCQQPAAYISRFGWQACEEHRSIADLRLDDVENAEEIKRRLELKPDENL